MYCPHRQGCSFTLPSLNTLFPIALKYSWSKKAPSSAKYFEKYSKNSEYKNFYGSPDDSGESSFDDYSDPIVIAKVIEKAISAKNPKTRYSAGAYSWILLTMRSILPDKWFDSLIVKVTG